MIEVRHLTKSFPRHTAVDNISFSVSPGEIVGFLGPNGAGKTTTMRMLTGFMPPTSGAASVTGHDIFRESVAARRHIGYMPENVPLYRDMRVKEYLRFRGKIKGLAGKRLKIRIGEVLDRCGLHPMRRRVIRTLSKGYRQRLGLADALIHEPGLLILDEPTNGLDPNQIRSIRQFIRELGKEHTILLSTHILSEVEMTCNKVIIIDNGKIKANDTPSALVANMRASGKITAELKAFPGPALAALGTLPAAKKILHERLEDGWHRYTLIANSRSEIRENVANIASRENWPLRSLHRHEASLEDVFVELTRKD